MTRTDSSPCFHRAHVETRQAVSLGTVQRSSEVIRASGGRGVEQGSGQVPVGAGCPVTEHGHWGQRPRAGVSLLHGESCRTRTVGGMADRRWGDQSPGALQAKGRTLAFVQNELGATAGQWAEGWHLRTSILEPKGVVCTKVLRAPAGTWDRARRPAVQVAAKRPQTKLGAARAGEEPEEFGCPCAAGHRGVLVDERAVRRERPACEEATTGSPARLPPDGSPCRRLSRRHHAWGTGRPVSVVVGHVPPVVLPSAAGVRSVLRAG